MKLERAKEIYDSYGVINVSYNSKPVWIEHIETEENRAQVKVLTTDEIIEVHVTDLKEE
ncbi:H-type small acid-soluble spore protein [Clostridium tunisiense]|uniref:H-type small acid-soluble spore protein n=1 Tax=Clostridium tunisiense TaxID=219748 RepID=UPI0002D65D9A|nr:H-type small acid-soluble spore protein [Clostridium tunisiense]